MKHLGTILLVTLAALAALPTVAQTGGMTVAVTDSEGEPLPGATVTISHVAGFVRTTSLLTGNDGLAEFPVLRPGGGYVIEVSFAGFGSLRLTDLRVRINESHQIPVRLSEELIERVQVQATREVVDLEEIHSSTKFTESFVQDLPVNGRLYQNVLTLAPGVDDADGDANPTVHGSRSRDFRAEVDGISNVDPLTGRWMSRINPNSIEEIEIITAGAGVEFGRAQGGFARILQKQGSNQLEGVFDFLLRSSKFDATAGNSAVGHPAYDFYQPGFQVSGPIVRDRLWYRLSHEFIDGEQPVNVVSGTEVTTTRAATHADQLTWQVSPRNKLALQFQSDPYEVDNFGVSSLVPAESSRRLKRTGKTYSLTWTAAYSPRLLAEARVAWQDLNLGTFPTSASRRNDCARGIDFLRRGQCYDLETGVLAGPFYRTHDDHRQRLTVRGDATIHAGRFWGARHEIKLGFVAENERYFRSLQVRPVMTYFEPPPPPLSGDEDEEEEPIGVLAAQIAVPGSDTVRATGTNWAVYVQDQLKPRDNLVVTAGLRVDREEIYSRGASPIDPRGEFLRYLELLDEGIPAHAAIPRAFTSFENSHDFTADLARMLGTPESMIQQSLPSLVHQSQFWEQTRLVENLDITNTNISPFLSFSWDPWSNGKTKLALAFSRHYNNLPLNVPLIELEPAVSDLTFVVDRETRWIVRLGDSVNPGVNVRVVDRELQTPYQDEIFFSFERELWTETSLRLSYIHRQYRDQLQDLNLNRHHGDFGRCRWATQWDPRSLEEVRPGDPDYDPELAPGDGLDDDCVGVTETYWELVGPFERLRSLGHPDGVIDLYTQSPGWGDVLEVGNHNASEYTGYVLELTRRRYRNWEMNGSYTYSRSVGDGEDFLQFHGNDSSLLEDEYGFQSDDRRHFVKLNAVTLTPWGFRLGAALSWRSGLPYSRLVQKLSQDAIPPQLENMGASEAARMRQRYLTHRRNDQRNSSYWNLDVKLTREANLGGRVNLQWSAEIFNLFDDRTYIVYNPFLGIGRTVNGRNEAFIRSGRQWQLGVKAAF